MPRVHSGDVVSSWRTTRSWLPPSGPRSRNGSRRCAKACSSWRATRRRGSLSRRCSGTRTPSRARPGCSAWTAWSTSRTGPRTCSAPSRTAGSRCARTSSTCCWWLPRASTARCRARRGRWAPTSWPPWWPPSTPPAPATTPWRSLGWLPRRWPRPTTPAAAAATRSGCRPAGCTTWSTSSASPSSTSGGSPGTAASWLPLPPSTSARPGRSASRSPGCRPRRGPPRRCTPWLPSGTSWVPRPASCSPAPRTARAGSPTCVTVRWGWPWSRYAGWSPVSPSWCASCPPHAARTTR